MEGYTRTQKEEGNATRHYLSIHIYTHTDTFLMSTCKLAFSQTQLEKSHRTASYMFCTPLKRRQTLAAKAFITKVQNGLQNVGYKTKSIQRQAPGYKQHESHLYTMLRKIHFDNDLVKLLCNTIILLVRALAQHLTPADSVRNPTFCYGFLRLF